MSVRSILVVDDERHLRQALFTALTRLGHAVEMAESGREALDKFQDRRFDLVICDLNTPGLDGLGVLRAVKQRNPGLPVILMTAHGSVEAAVEAMREGAHDFILKPFPAGVIEEAVNRALAGSAAPPPAAPPAREERGENARPLLTRNQRMVRLLEMARTVAASPSTVLLQGESGTGKELLARFIHQHSPRADGAFVAVNCASLPENLLESELFGHEKGSFTGAVARKQGKFELADGGTILLDEVSEMDLALQAKLLRVLQEGEIDRVGGKEPQKVDVRVIATTNRNLKAWADSGRFRTDLYYRLNVIPFFLPPLKDRLDDLPLLADHFRRKFARQNNKNVTGLSAAALGRLAAYDWPGNIRELENTVARGVLLASGPEVEPGDLFMDEAGFMAALERSLPAPGAAVPSLPADDQPEAGPAFMDPAFEASLEESLAVHSEVRFGAPDARGLMTIEEMERRLIGQALNETEGNRTHAARILGISVRTLRNKLAEYRAPAA